MGGKSRLAPQIVTRFPEHTCYVEPFAGACWVLLAKETPSKVEVINDIDSELITFWRVVQNHLEEFLRYYRYVVTAREQFDIEMKKEPETLTDVQRACRFYYLQKMSFGGRKTNRTFGTATTSRRCVDIYSLEESLWDLHHRFSRVLIENLTANNCIKKYDRAHSLFYLDPPYYETAGYEAPFGEKDYAELAVLLQNVRGKFALSLNDVPAVRKLFKGFSFEQLNVRYSVGTKGSSRAKTSPEVLITNY